MEIDTTKPNAARIYDYYLGGNHNVEVDRQAAEQPLIGAIDSGRANEIMERLLEQIGESCSGTHSRA